MEDREVLYSQQKQDLALIVWITTNMLNLKETNLPALFAAEDGEALYSQQKQDWELIVAQVMNSLLPNSDLN